MASAEFKTKEISGSRYLFKGVGTQIRTASTSDILEKSVDEDGFPHRVLSKINILSNKISENFEDSLVYVDYPSIVKQLISSGYPYNKLFSDWIHPSILGHIIMGRSAVCNILKFQKLKSKESEDFCKILSVQDLEPMIESYKRTLNISLSDTIRSKKIIYRWAVLLSRVTAHPEDFYKIAEEHLYYMYPNFKTNQNDNLSILVLSALFQANQGEKCDNLKLLLNKALSISPSKVHDLLEDPFPFLKFPEGQLNIKQTFEKAGLRLDFSNSTQAKCSA